MPNIVLASSSIYRKELLSRLQIPFSTYSPDIDESSFPGESWQALVQRLATEKAKVAYQAHPHCICIGSDEVGAFGTTLLNKPGNHTTAVEQLKQMSGQTVFFYTAVCVYAPFVDFEDCQLAITTVKFRELTDSMIEHYLLKEKPYTSAGSFKSETLGCALIESMQGDDPTAIIGLPLIRLCEMLRKVGVHII